MLIPSTLQIFKYQSKLYCIIMYLDKKSLHLTRNLNVIIIYIAYLTQVHRYFMLIIRL